MMVSIILPTYNEFESVLKVIDEIRRVMKLLNYTYEIIVVDDSSADGTGKLVQDTYVSEKEVMLISRRDTKPNLGNSILDGIIRARGDVIVGMDADGNHPPNVLGELIKILEQGRDMVIASRYVSINFHNFRIQDVGSLFFNLLIKVLLRYPIMDNTSGYYAIKTELLKKLPIDKIFENSYGEYHIRLVWSVNMVGGKMMEIPVTYGKRISGKSKSKLWRMFFSYFIEALKWKYA